MGEIIQLGKYWGYIKNRCDGCKFLEISEPFQGGERLYACDAPDGKCVRDGFQNYSEKE